MSDLRGADVRWRVGAAVAALGASLAVAAPATAATATGSVAVIVVTDHGVKPGPLIVGSGGQVERQLPLIHAAAGQVPAAAVATLRVASGVRSLTVDRAYTLRGDEPDAAAAGVTGVDVRSVIGADRLDPGAEGGAGIDVAIVDSGISPVPGLEGHLLDGPDFSTEASNPVFAHIDAFGHGTHMAGIVAGRDESGLGTGVAPGARVVNVKVADHEGATSLISLLAGIDWSVRNAHTGGRNIRVLNLATRATHSPSRSSRPGSAASPSSPPPATAVRRRRGSTARPMTPTSSQSAPRTRRGPWTTPTTAWPSSPHAAAPSVLPT
jgi:serine protease AprX